MFLHSIFCSYIIPQKVTKVTKLVTSYYALRAVTSYKINFLEKGNKGYIKNIFFQMIPFSFFRILSVINRTLYL